MKSRCPSDSNLQTCVLITSRTNYFQGRILLHKKRSSLRDLQRSISPLWFRRPASKMAVKECLKSECVGIMSSFSTSNLVIHATASLRARIPSILVGFACGLVWHVFSFAVPPRQFAFSPTSTHCSSSMSSLHTSRLFGSALKYPSSIGLRVCRRSFLSGLLPLSRQFSLCPSCSFQLARTAHR